MFCCAFFAFGNVEFATLVASKMELFVTKEAGVLDLPLKNIGNKVDIVIHQGLGFTGRIIFHYGLTDNHLSFQSCCTD